jgi:hypothetical protein
MLAAGLGQALGGAAGIINAFGLVVVFGGLIGACIMALSERHVGGVKTSLVIAAVGGLARVIAQAMFAAGGNPPSPTSRSRQSTSLFRWLWNCIPTTTRGKVHPESGSFAGSPWCCWSSVSLLALRCLRRWMVTESYWRFSAMMNSCGSASA